MSLWVVQETRFQFTTQTGLAINMGELLDAIGVQSCSLALSPQKMHMHMI